MVGAVALVAIGALINIDYEKWKTRKYEQAGYTEVARPDGLVWVGTGLKKEDVSFRVYFGEKMVALGIVKGKL